MTQDYKDLSQNKSVYILAAPYIIENYIEGLLDKDKDLYPIFIVSSKGLSKRFETTLKRKGVIHSFTSGPELAQYAIDQGFCLGFNGICTFNTAENVRDIIRMTPLENIILETDAPYLTPVPYRGKENASCYLPFVAEKVADVKNVNINEFLPIVYANSQALFFPE